MPAATPATTRPLDASARLGGLDVFRFALCAVVVFAHFWYLGPSGIGQGWPGVHLPELSLLAYAVQGFFMISGFAIMYTIKGRTAVAFAIARIARMWPALAVCSLVTWLAVRHAYTWSPGVQQVINSWLVLPLASHRGAGADWSYWTMTFELRFYAFVFLAMLIADVHRYRLPMLAAWLGVTVYDSIAPGNNIAHFIALDWYGGSFIVGGLTYVIWEQRGLSRKIAAMLLLPAFYVCSIQMLGEYTEQHESWRTVPMMHVTMWIVPVVSWLLLVGSLMWKKPFGNARVAKFAAFLGAITYPLYLVHQLVGYRIINDLSHSLPSGLVWVAPWVATMAALAVGSVVAIWWEPLARPVVQSLLKFVAERFAYTRPAPTPKQPEAAKNGGGPIPMVHAE
jgi:peptidoglycan/LPS O-acetylase OafA/YrhL